MLANKVIVVTGGGRGIGRSIALAAAQAGAAVVVNDPGSDPRGDGGEAGLAQRVVDEIEAGGGRAAAQTGSVTSPEDAEAMIALAEERFGRIDGVVNNAGILRDALFHKMTHEDFRAVVEVHLFGSFNVARAAATRFRAQESGAYVHMVSTSGLIGNLGQSNYAAAKLGIAGLSRSIAFDMERFGVRSNAIAPFAWSRLTGSIPQTTDAEKARVERFKQMKPEQVAPLAVALLSDRAQGTTGQVFVVRAGEIFLMNQPRPIRAMHSALGWTTDEVAERVFPAFAASYTPLERSADVFPWDPI